MANAVERAASLRDRLYKELANRRTFVRDMEEAYRGRHSLRYASEKWREYHEKRYRGFSDNWCAPVANAPNERLRNMGIRLSDAPGKPSRAETQLQDDWNRNDMDEQSSQGWLQSIVASRSFVLVWDDGSGDGVPVDTWERPDQFIIDYDPANRRRKVAALKSWCDDDTEYVTLYTPDSVWKWSRPYVPSRVSRVAGNPVAEGFFYNAAGVLVPISEAGEWEERRAPEDNAWPVPNPLGEVPATEFANRPVLGSSPLSEIAGTMAMQHAINLLWAYLFNAADHASMPARVIMGQEPPMIPVLDKNGQVVGEKPMDSKDLTEGRLLYLTGQDTKIGQWDSAKLDVFTNVIETAVTHIAAQTRTPPHYLVMGAGMVNVNAEGMKAAETGLVMKVKEEQLFFTPPTRDVYRLNALVRGDEATAEKCRTATIQWKDAENRSQAQLVDALLKLQTMGFPFQWIAEQYGLSDTEVARVIDLKRAEAEADPIGAMAQGLGQQLPMAPAEDAPAVD